MKNHMSWWVGCGVILAVVTGCSTGELGHTMGSWQGSHVDDVALAWGQPDICETTDDRRICAWYDIVSGFSLSSARTCTRSLELDADGYVTGWRWRGDYCFATTDYVLARAQFDRPDALAAESRKSKRSKRRRPGQRTSLSRPGRGSIGLSTYGNPATKRAVALPISSGESS